MYPYELQLAYGLCTTLVGLAEQSQPGELYVMGLASIGRWDGSLHVLSGTSSPDFVTLAPGVLFIQISDRPYFCAWAPLVHPVVTWCPLFMLTAFLRQMCDSHLSFEFWLFIDHIISESRAVMALNFLVSDPWSKAPSSFSSIHSDVFPLPPLAGPSQFS